MTLDELATYSRHMSDQFVADVTAARNNLVRAIENLDEDAVKKLTEQHGEGVVDGILTGPMNEATKQLEGLFK